MTTPPASRYPLESSVLLLDLYRLASLFLASDRFRTLSKASSFHHDSLGALAAYFEESEAFRILLAAAIWLRVQLDQGHAEAPNPAAVVGSLRVKAATGDTVEDLTLREACNKIIHGQGFHVSYRDTDTAEQYLSGHITFTGAHRNVPWEAALDVLAFIRAANPSP